VIQILVMPNFFPQAFDFFRERGVLGHGNL
jgi:hypothetical protein